MPVSVQDRPASTVTSLAHAPVLRAAKLPPLLEPEDEPRSSISMRRTS
jgi:hypothetical protein